MQAAAYTGAGALWCARLPALTLLVLNLQLDILDRGVVRRLEMDLLARQRLDKDRERRCAHAAGAVHQ